MKPRILIILWVLAFAHETAGQQYFFRQYTHAEGLLHSFVYDINQDNNGFLWVGTPDGLYQFDGFDFKHFTTEDQLADNFVTKIFKDAQGRVWIGHQNGSVSLLLKDGFTRLNEYADGQGSVTDFAEDDLGSIWFSNQTQGLKIIAKDHTIATVSFPDVHESLTQIEYLGAGQFMVGSQENLYLAKYNRDSSSMDVVHHYSSYPGSRVVEIFQNAFGGYVVVSQDFGIYCLSPNANSEGYTFSIIDENPDGLLDNLQGGILDGKGDLWFHSMGNGLLQYSSMNDQTYVRVSRISTSNGLVSENVRSMFEDVEGNLWIGMYGEGLLRYVDNNLKYFQHNVEQESVETYGITEFNDGFLVATDNRLLRMNQFGDTIRSSYSLPVDRVGDRLNTVFAAYDGTIWLGFEQSGVFASGVDSKEFKPVFISNDELSNSVNFITGTGEYLWIGTKKGLCRITNGSGKLIWFTTNEGLPHNNINQLCIDSAGRVLIATLCNKIHYISENGIVEVLEHAPMDPMNPIVSFAEDNYGRLWVATYGNGVWMIKNDSILNYNTSSGLFSDFCYSLAFTKEGEPIIGHTGGISIIIPGTSRIKTFGRLEGVRSSTDFYPNAIFANRLGRIWFGTSEGLIRYASGISKGGMMAPKLHICSVLIDGDTIDHAGGLISLKPGQYELVVNFIGISFTNPEMVFYQTQLEGYNQDWSQPTFSRTVVFDRIGHGNYTFKIRAYNENDVKSETSSAFRLKIKKPVYLSMWFYSIIILLIGITFYMILRIRERNHRMVQERLLKNIDEKTKEIIVKEEIIKERKKVEKVLIEAKTKAELSEQLKTSFLQNMSHEIRTPMNAIVGFTQLLSEEGVSNETRDDFISKVSTNAESLLKLIDDILDLSMLETNQLRINKEEVEVNAIIHDVESIFRNRLSVENNEDIEFAVMCPGKDELEIVADRTRLIQVLNNLLDNALKFTPNGRIILGYTVDESNIIFFVEDTGIGLSEDKKGIVFDLFRKVEDDRFKLYGGTGLGLTLAKYLVKMMGGEIDVESKQDVGSKFYFNIPLISQN